MESHTEDNEGEERFETWASLKQRLFDDDELAAEDGIVLGPVLREASGREVASRLDALVRHFRSVWRACLDARPASDREQERDDSDGLMDVCLQARQLVHTWFAAFNCLREAERWFYKEYGPQKDTELLDELAGSLFELYLNLETMYTCPIDWEDVADIDENGYTAEALAHLHTSAREFEEKAGVVGRTGGGVDGCSDLRRITEAAQDGSKEQLLADDAPRAQSESIPDDSTLSPRELAKLFGVSAEPLRKRLERLRKGDLTCFVEVPDRTSTQPQFLYKVGKVRRVIESLKTSSRASGKRPARKKRS